MKKTRYTSIIFCFLIAALLFSDSAVGRQLGEDRLGHEWSVTEAVTYTGHWVRRGNSEIWDATWNNGAVAVLTITISGDKVRISRKDVTGPSIGATAIYEGTLAADGTIQGTETVTWPGHFTNQTQSWQGRIVKGDQPPPPPPEINFSGRWNLIADGFTFVLELEQANGVVRGRMTPTAPMPPGNPPSTVEGSARGREIVFRRITPGGLTQEYRGYIFNVSSGHTMGGIFEHAKAWTYGWYATR